MTASKDLQAYLTLMRIRAKYALLNTWITGGVFAFGVVILFGGGLLDWLDGKSIYLIALAVALFGIGFVMTWVRLAILNGTVETIETLQQIMPEAVKV